MFDFVQSSVPLHHQIAQVLRLRIEAGIWPPSGARVTEQDLCGEFSVSRTTIRLALSALKQAGLLKAKRGVGTEGVNLPVRRQVVGSGGDPLHASLGTHVRVVHSGEADAPAAAAAFFALSPGERLWRIVRVHLLKGEPLSVVDSYLPAALGAALPRRQLRRPMHDLLWQHFALRQAHSVHTIRVARADIDVAPLLGIALADPVLQIQSSVHLPDGKPIRWIRNSFREDRYEYVAEMEWALPTEEGEGRKRGTRRAWRAGKRGRQS
jgi:GntR family transcriptional regulator